MKKLIGETKIGENKTVRVYAGATTEELVASLEETKAVAGDEETRRAVDEEIEYVKRLGRKPKPARKRRDLSVRVRFNADEFDLLRRLFDPEEDELAVFIRKLALEAARSRLADAE